MRPEYTLGARTGTAMPCTKSRFHYRRLSNSFGDNPVSFTPGFSQVNCAKQRLETVLKVSGRFPLLLTLPITRLKPGVNENVDLPFCAKRNGHLYISTERPQQSGCWDLARSVRSIKSLTHSARASHVPVRTASCRCRAASPPSSCKASSTSCRN